MEKPIETEATKLVEVETTRYTSLPIYTKVIFFVLTIFGLGIAVFYLFSFRVGDFYLYEVAYYYLFAGTFLACAFLVMPARKQGKGVPRKGVPWYDYLAAASAFFIAIYFYLNGWDIGQIGWIPPTPFNFVLALIYCLLLLEAARRMAGPIYLVVVLIIGLYPLFAGHMPGLLFGITLSPLEVVGRNIFGWDGMIGLPARILAGLLVGFLLFAGTLMATGAGKFFLDLSTALLGRFRGGPAKVAVVASGFFGSLSGDPMANIVATGSFTIPTMKRLGYPAHYAGAIEAAASTGGMVMPPVMGAAAFVMAAFLGVDYAVIIVVAAIPAILYYFGLLMQVDAYAARVGLKGLPREELPSLKKTLKQGWPFVVVLVFLVWGLVYMKWSIYTPFYATGLMILLSFRSRETMMTPKRIIEVLSTVGKLIAQVTGMILTLCFLLVGLSSTGVSGAFTQVILYVSGGNVIVILITAMILCYIFGLVGITMPAYVFLVVSMVPAVVEVAGLNVMALHLFIIYYTLLSMLTPPVAPAAFIAAALAEASPMKTAVQSMRLGIVLYFIPFFFVFNPSLILQGPILDAVYLFALCLLGILLIAAGLEGYLVKVGRVGLWARPLLVVGGTLIAFPEWNTTFIGAALAAIVVAITLVRKKWAAGMG